MCRKFFVQFMKKGSLSKQWAYDVIQQKAVRRAMIAEIRQSPLGALQKVLLISYLRGASTLILTGVKSIAKRASPPAACVRSLCRREAAVTCKGF